MQLTKKDLKNSTSQLSIAIEEKDYAEKVAQKLKEYRRNVDMPGFRKGKVPMDLIKKKYKTALVVDEVNKQLQESINTYLTENKIGILGYPIPSKKQKEIDWENEHDFEFVYELGLAPEVEVNLEDLKAIKSYKITADKKMIDKEVDRIKEQYGSFNDIKTVKKAAFVLGTFSNEEEDIVSQTTVRMDDLTEDAQKLLLRKKKGDEVQMHTKNLFKDPHTMIHALNISHDKVHGLEVPVMLKVEGVFEMKPAEINKELLDKVFGEGKIENEAGLHKFIKEDLEKQFEQSSDNRLLNDVTDKLLSKTKIALPEDFLKSWIEVDSKGEITGEKAVDEYEKAEKGLKYQLVEEAIIKKHKLQVSYDELVNLTKDLVKYQMLQYGQSIPEDEQMNEIVDNILKNNEEVKKLTDQLIKKKLVKLYKEVVPVKETKITYDKFLDLK